MRTFILTVFIIQVSIVILRLLVMPIQKPTWTQLADVIISAGLSIWAGVLLWT